MKQSDINLSLLSTHLGIENEKFEEEGILNPTYEEDVPLFIDPLLLKNSSEKIFREEARKKYEDFFSEVLKLASLYVQADNDEKNKIKERIIHKLKFKEQPGTNIGYSKHSVKGRGIGLEKANQIAEPVLNLIEKGYKKTKNIFQTVFMLEEGIGADLISDMTAFIIRDELAFFTQEISVKWGIKTKIYRINETKYNLPEHPQTGGYVLFLPNDILDALPIFREFDEIISDFKNAAQRDNCDIRMQVSEDIEKILNKARSDANRLYPNNLKEAQKNAYQEYKNKTREYIYSNFCAVDSFADYFSEENFSEWKRSQPPMIHEILDKIPRYYPILKNIKIDNSENMSKIVHQMILDFAHIISSDNNVKRHLFWNDGKCAKEKSWQSAFYLFIQKLLKENNIDITPEFETGMGPTDFKFSIGENKKILIEIKLASNSKYLHGYKTQLELYKKATSNVLDAYFIFIDNIGEKAFSKKLDKLYQEKNKNDISSKIIPVDGMIHESASKAEGDLL